MKVKKILIFAAIVLLSCSPTVTVNNMAVDKVDLPRYLGRWYELARFDHSFEKEMSHTTANYALRSDGKIEVENAGMKDGKRKRVIGTAVPSKQEGILNVTFFFLFKSEYRILEVSEDYRYALVGGKSDDYLWIMSRTPSLPKSDIDYLIEAAKKRGYAVESLVWVDQSVKDILPYTFKNKRQTTKKRYAEIIYPTAVTPSYIQSGKPSQEQDFPL